MIKTTGLAIVNTSVVIATTLADIEIYLKISLLILTISYTAWKFISDYSNSKKQEKPPIKDRKPLRK